MQVRWIGSFLLSLLGLASIALAEPGVTEKEVVIGTSTPLSGPAAAWGTTALGMEAWAKYINDQGGVHGRKIRVVIKDDAYNPGRAVANVKEVKDEVFAWAGQVGTAVIHAIRDTLTEGQIPFVYPYGNVRMWKGYPKERLRYIFAQYPDYTDEGEFLATYALQELKVRRVAVFYQNDEYGRGGLEGVRRGLGKVGKAELEAEVPYELAEREFRTHALKLKESGAEAVILYTTPAQGALILKEMAKVGYRPKILSSFTLGDPLMFQVAGDLWEGVYVDVTGSIVGTDPEANRVAEILVKYEPRIRGRENFGVFGAITMMTVVEGLRRAGRDLTRERFIQALETLKDWRPEGLGAPITFGPTRHHGLNAVRLMRAEKGRYVPVTGYQLFPPHF